MHCFTINPNKQKQKSESKHYKGFSPQKFNLNFHLLTIVLTISEFSLLHLRVPLLPPFKLYLHKKQTNLNYSGNLRSLCFHMHKSCWLPNLLEEKQNQNTAILYKSPSIGARQKHHVGFCNPVSVPVIACRWDKFNWRLVTSLYLKITPQNHKPQEIIKSKSVWRTQTCCHKHSTDF